MESIDPTPFTGDYVIALTLKHMRKSLDISIAKTLARIAEFDGNQEKSQEVFKTLIALHTLKKSLENSQSQIIALRVQ